jgi:hypothetical protein
MRCEQTWEAIEAGKTTQFVQGAAREVSSKVASRFKHIFLSIWSRVQDELKGGKN